MPNSTVLRVYYNKKAHPSDKTFKSSCACICYQGNDIIHILFLFSDPFNIFVLDFFILYVWMLCLYVCIYTMCLLTIGFGRSHGIPLKLGRVLGTEPRSSAKATGSFNQTVHSGSSDLLFNAIRNDKVVHIKNNAVCEHQEKVTVYSLTNVTVPSLLITTSPVHSFPVMQKAAKRVFYDAVWLTLLLNNTPKGF